MKVFDTYHHHKSLAILTFVVVIFMLASPIVGGTATATTEVEATKKIPPYMITTRDRLIYGYEEIQEPGYNNSYSFRNVSQLTQSPCPNEIAIFVHGWDTDEDKAKERFDRVKLSLENNSYTHPLVGLSWDSDQAWLSAKFVAKDNGPQLAKFIVKTMDECTKQQPEKDVKIRLIGHSLGARVVLSALDSLNKNQTWNNTIASVHLMAGCSRQRGSFNVSKGHIK